MTFDILLNIKKQALNEIDGNVKRKMKLPEEREV